MFSFINMWQASTASFNADSNNLLNKVLNKIQAFVQADAITYNPLYDNTSSTLFRDDDSDTWKDAKHFLQKIEGGVAFLNILEGWKIRRFKIDFGTDLSQWEVNDIAELKVFFAAFKVHPIQLTLDAGQVNGLGTEKLNAFLDAVKPAKIENIRVARPYTGNKEETLCVSEENLKLIYKAFPQAVIEQARYFGSSDEPVTSKLIYAEKTSTLSIEAKPQPDQPAAEQKEPSLPTPML